VPVDDSALAVSAVVILSSIDGGLPVRPSREFASSESACRLIVAKVCSTSVMVSAAPTSEQTSRMS
jgi:hypothetical protein